MRRIEPTLREQARHLRRTMTWHERELWEQVRQSRLGVRFRRQHPIGQYIVDFAAPTPRIVVEIDGWSHADTAAESVRDAELHGKGWAVMHFLNRDIADNLDRVLDEIRAEIAKRLGQSRKRDRSKSDT